MARKSKAKQPPRFVLPDGFTPHHGGDCPVDPGQHVEPIVRTAEGYASAGVCPARMHAWPHAAHDEEGGLGAVVGYREAAPGEPPRLGPLDRF